MEWTPSCRLFSFKYTVPYIVSAIEVKAFFAHILLFQMTLSLSFIPRILPQSLFLATHPLARGSFPIPSDVCLFLHISLSPLQENQMYLDERKGNDCTNPCNYYLPFFASWFIPFRLTTIHPWIERLCVLLVQHLHLKTYEENKFLSESEFLWVTFINTLWSPFTWEPQKCNLRVSSCSWSTWSLECELWKGCEDARWRRRR